MPIIKLQTMLHKLIKAAPKLRKFTPRLRGRHQRSGKTRNHHPAPNIKQRRE